MEQEEKLLFSEHDFAYYTFRRGRADKGYKPISENKLIWNVISDTGSYPDKIEVFNIFDHCSFFEDLCNIKKKAKDDFATFAEEVLSSLRYYYWSKSEWEVVVTSWPPYIEAEDIDKLVEEKEENIKKYGHCYRLCPNLSTGEKIDVYNQVMLNWDQFIKYLWEHKNLLKKSKR